MRTALVSLFPVVLVLVFALGMPVAAHAQVGAARFEPSRDAARDVAAAVAQARAERKRVLVDVGGEWCSWCHILDRFFAADSEARTLRDANYVMVKVNYSKENRNQAFLSAYPPVPGYPHLFVLDGDGKLVQSQDTGALEQGEGYNRDKVVAFLKAYAPPRRTAAAVPLVPLGLGHGTFGLRMTPA